MGPEPREPLPLAIVPPGVDERPSGADASGDLSTGPYIPLEFSAPLPIDERPAEIVVGSAHGDLGPAPGMLMPQEGAPLLVIDERTALIGASGDQVLPQAAPPPTIGERPIFAARASGDQETRIFARGASDGGGDRRVDT